MQGPISSFKFIFGEQVIVPLDLEVTIIRRASADSCLFPDLFQGFEKVAAVKRIFGARTNQTLKSVRILFSTREGYLRVDNDTGDIIISSPYLQTAAERDFYLDLIHELVHVRQFKEGKDLFDKKYSYVDRPTEIEAYSVAVDEARRIGMTEREIVDYLRVEWVNDEDFKRLLRALGVRPAKSDRSGALTRQS
jgi:hypothetical protein